MEFVCFHLSAGSILLGITVLGLVLPSRLGFLVRETLTPHFLCLQSRDKPVLLERGRLARDDAPGAGNAALKAELGAFFLLEQISSHKNIRVPFAGPGVNAVQLLCSICLHKCSF